MVVAVVQAIITLEAAVVLVVFKRFPKLLPTLAPIIASLLARVAHKPLIFTAEIKVPTP